MKRHGLRGPRRLLRFQFLFRQVANPSQPVQTFTWRSRSITQSITKQTVLKSLNWSLLLLVAGTVTSALALDSISRQRKYTPKDLTVDARTLSDMPILPGHLGNLTLEQEQKLAEFWAVLLKTFGVKDLTLHPTAFTSVSISEPGTDTDSPSTSVKKKKRHSLFGSKKHDGEDVDHSATDDKYGQTKEYHMTLKEMSPEEVREAFWSMVKADHPDALLLRFLRARKWDIHRALFMLVATMRWRSKELHVDDDVMQHGEGGAVLDSQGTDAFAKKEGEDFLAQMRKGKSFVHGSDKEGRPICFVRVKLHKPGEQSERSLERYTVFVIETARLVLRSPVETATIFFDMTDFSLANMDYAPVKFMIKVFEANYPESLGSVLVHKSPWAFQAIWAIIKGWLDPVVAAKIHFTKTIDDLEQFIPRSHIAKDLGGDEEWTFRYVEPKEEEDVLMKDSDKRKELEGEREKVVLEFQKKTFDWLSRTAEEATGSKTSDGSVAKEQAAKARNDIAHQLYENYWRLDPFIRARSLYDRQGMIGPGGVIDFYPEKKKNEPAIDVPANGSIATNPNDVD